MANHELNKVIHEQTKLKILVLLASSVSGIKSFTDIKTDLHLTSGNVSIQLKTLEEAGLVAAQKIVAGTKVRTEVCITPAGRQSLLEYLETLEHMLSAVKKNSAQEEKEE